MLADWQPIKTAPMDGTRIIACGMTKPIMGLTPSRPAKPFMGIIYRKYDMWQAGRLGVVADPTHWMPLPEPPKEKEGCYRVKIEELIGENDE